MQNYIIYKVGQGETKQSIADIFCVSIANVISDKKQVEAGDRVVVNTTQATTYIVKPGDTLEHIAALYKVDKQVIKEKNNITRLFVGQQLFI